MKRARITGPSETDMNLKTTSKTELDLFTKPVEQNAIIAARDFEFGPDWSLGSDTAIQFTLPVSDDYFVDLANAYLKVQLRVLKSDGTALDESDEGKVAPVVGFFDALFAKIVLTLGHVTIGGETANHPQLAYLRNLLNFGDEFKAGALRDTMGYGEEIKMSDGKIGFASWRHTLIEKSCLLTMCSRLQSNFFNCSKLMLPNLPITIRLERTSPAFSLLTKPGIPDTYKIEMRSCTLFVRKVTVSPQTVSMINHKLASQSAIYPYMRTELRHFLIPTGSMSVKHLNLYTGQLPTRLLFAVCPSISVSGGSFQNNPMVFDGAKWGISYVQFYIDGVPTSFNAFTPNFDSEDYVMSYVGLLRALRLMNSSQPFCPVTYKGFGGGVTIFGADLSADMSNLAMPSNGSISIEVRFKNNITESLNGLVVAEYRSCVQVDKNGDVTQNDL